MGARTALAIAALLAVPLPGCRARSQEDVRGVGEGLAVPVSVGPGLAESGVAVFRAARRRGEVPTIRAYLVSEKPFAGTLRVRALSGGHELGRSQTSLERTAGEAGYVDFTFDPRVPLANVTELELALVAR